MDLYVRARAHLKDRDMPGPKAMLGQTDVDALLTLIQELTSQERVVIFRLLDKPMALALFEQLDLEQRQDLISTFPHEQTLAILTNHDVGFSHPLSADAPGIGSGSRRRPDHHDDQGHHRIVDLLCAGLFFARPAVFLEQYTLHFLDRMNRIFRIGSFYPVNLVNPVKENGIVLEGGLP